MNMYDPNQSPPTGTPEETMPPCTGEQMRDLDGKPLAMVYSPKQFWHDAYEPDEALMRGTLFRELDKPILTANGTTGGGAKHG